MAKRGGFGKEFLVLGSILVVCGTTLCLAVEFFGLGRTTGCGRGMTMASALASAVENFYGEYSRLPEVDGPKLNTNTLAGAELLNILMAQEEKGVPRQNERKITFLQGKQAIDRLGGLEMDGDRALGCYDPFGSPFWVFLNSEYGDELVFEWGGQQVRLRGKQVAVASVGKDGKEGTEDDIRSWK